MRMLAMVLLVSGCSARAPGETAFLLLDRDAREAGLRVAVGAWEGAPVLPLALRPEEPAVLIAQGNTRLPIALRAGALGWVRGAAAQVDWGAVPSEIREDRVIVEGTDASVHTLAEMLAAEAGALADGRWELRAADVYERASFLTPPDGILEAAPSTIAPLLTRTAILGITGEAAPSGPGPAIAIVGSAAEVVGVYTSGGQVLIFDAEGGFSGKCSESGGRWTLDGDGRVALTYTDGSHAFFERAGDALRSADGAIYAPLHIESTITPPSEGQP
jgi:hypothetical protein